MSADFRLHTYAAARNSRKGPRKNGPVTAKRVCPAAWRAALTLARGDYRRLRIQSPTEVVVLNRPGSRRQT